VKIGPKRGGSKSGGNISKARKRLEGHAMPYTDYFVEKAIYIPRRIFTVDLGCTKELLMTILHNLRGPNKGETTHIMTKIKRGDFLRCSEASIACIGHVRIIQLLGKVFTNGHHGYCIVTLYAMSDNDIWI
jgi:hypothetical protein